MAHNVSKQAESEAQTKPEVEASQSCNRPGNHYRPGRTTTNPFLPFFLSRRALQLALASLAATVESETRERMNLFLHPAHTHFMYDIRNIISKYQSKNNDK